MDITEIIKESFVFPANNLKQLALYIVISIVVSIFALGGILAATYAESSAVYAVLGVILVIVSLIIAFILAGYQIKIIKSGIDQGEVLDIDWKNDFITGIKAIIVNIVYYIIPAIIVVIVGFIAGIPAAIGNIGQYVIENSTNATSIADSTVVDSIPPELLNSFASSVTVTAIIALILFIIFAFALMMGLSRLAKTDSLGEALNIPEALKDISRIGVGKVIATVILIFIIVIIIGVIFGFISIIVPPLSFLSILINPYLMFFSYRAVGSLYSDIA